MLPESLLKFSTNQGRIIPHYLDERDHPWLGLLWEEYLRHIGKPKADLIERLTMQLPFCAPVGKRQMVSHTLNRAFRTQVTSRIPPRELRARLFVAAANSSLSRGEICERVASEFGICPDELENGLYADLPSQRCLTAPAKTVPPNELALHTNLMLIQGLLSRARSVDILMTGNSGAVVRHAKRKGLICVVSKGAADGKANLALSGPYSLFRCTLLYGRVLGDLIPVLAWCNEFELSAEIVLGDKSLELRVRSGDPIFPSEPPKPFDSKLEERFCRAFLRASKTWDIIREPEPISVAGTLIFPDFALQNRNSPDKRWLLEIVGYWTPDYLRKKLERLREARIPNLLLCVSDKLNCAEGDLPEGASVIRFNKRLEPKDVLSLIGE